MVYTQNITHSTIGLHILFSYNQNNHMYSQGRQGGGGIALGPHLNSRVVNESYVASPSQVTSHFLQVQVKSQVIWSEFKSSHKSFGLNPSQVKSQVIPSGKSIQIKLQVILCVTKSLHFLFLVFPFWHILGESPWQLYIVYLCYTLVITSTQSKRECGSIVLLNDLTDLSHLTN
jgi:hypothetical protein